MRSHPVFAVPLAMICGMNLAPHVVAQGHITLTTDGSSVTNRAGDASPGAPAPTGVPLPNSALRSVTPSRTVPRRELSVGTRSSRPRLRFGPEQGGFQYAHYFNRIEIRSFTGAGGRVTIPATIKGLPVTSIGQSAFADRRDLTEVTIPASVTVIRDKAFLNCGNLSEITLPAGVTTIEWQVFSGCDKLTELSIPASVTFIDDGAFQGCSALAAINVEAANPSYSSVDGVLFDKKQTILIACPPGKAGTVSIPAGVTRIEARAFLACTKLNDVAIPSSVAHIGDDAFEDCPNLPPALRAEEKRIDSGDYSYTINAIGEAAIAGFSKNHAGSLSIATSLGGRPITSIKGGAFRDCAGLTDVTIPDTVISIGAGAFDGCTGLTGITIPASVTTIGGGAFYRCSSLKSLTTPPSVTRIGRYAFHNCSSLTSFAISPGISRIEYGVFLGCSGLKKVTIPDTVTSIGEREFSECNSLAAIEVDAANPNFSSVDGVLFDKGRAFLLQYPRGRIGGFAIPGTITKIGGGMFAGCTGLTDITIPDSVSIIGPFAFGRCTGLTKLTIPASVTNIGFCAFNDCANLKHVYFLGNAPDIPGGVNRTGYPPPSPGIGPSALRRVLPPLTKPSGEGVPPPALRPGPSADPPAIPAPAPIERPTTGASQAIVFFGTNNATVYYTPGAMGWGEEFDGRPTVAWDPQRPADPAVEAAPTKDTR